MMKKKMKIKKKMILIKVIIKKKSIYFLVDTDIAKLKSSILYINDFSKIVNLIFELKKEAQCPKTLSKKF